MPDSDGNIPNSSHDHAEEPGGGQSTAPPSQNKQGKRRASRAGTRSVASLTPDQLERKRANDREAQRSIRQRTKTRIDELEQRISELTRERQHGALELAQRRNQELEEELRHLRTLLGQPAGSAASSPDLEASNGAFYLGSIASNAYAPQYGSQSFGMAEQPMPFPTNAGELMTSYDSSLESSGFIFSEPHACHGLYIDTGQETTSTPTAPLSARGRDMAYATRPSVGRSRSYPHGKAVAGVNDSPFPNSSMDIPPIFLPSHSFPPGNRSGSPPQYSPLSNEPPGLKQEIFDPAAAYSTNTLASSSRHPASSSILTFNTLPSTTQPPWSTLLQFLPPIGQLDKILHHILSQQRSLPYPPSDPRVSGVLRPSIRGLVQPSNGNQDEPISYMLCQFLSRVSLKALAERTACLVVIYRFFQLVLNPCRETWEGLPVFMQPTEARRGMQGQLWVSMLVWPPIRAAILSNPAKYLLPSEELEHSCNAALSIAWPYAESEILDYEEGGDVRVSQAFMDTIWKLESWELGEGFGARWPELWGLL